MIAERMSRFGASGARTAGNQPGGETQIGGPFAGTIEDQQLLLDQTDSATTERVPPDWPSERLPPAGAGTSIVAINGGLYRE